MIKILFVCHGNICRSTMAQSVFSHLVQQEGLADKFEIDSAATSREEIGNPPHYGTREKLQQKGIALVMHKARKMNRDDYLYYDYLIGMDEANRRDMVKIAGGEDYKHKIYKMLDFTDLPGDVADPWYTGDFESTYRDVCRGCEGLLAFLQGEEK